MTTTITKSGLKATISIKGAELISLQDEQNTEFIWEGNPEFWGKHSPVLFPIVGTLKNNSYQYQEKTYHLSRHGFARDMEFSIIEKTENSVTFSLSSSAETLKVFPFEFELQLVYTLENTGLSIQYRVFNNNETEMPFSLGAHPAFALPGNFEDYSLLWTNNDPLYYNLLDKDLLSSVTQTLVLEDRKLALNYKLFENDALVFKTPRSKSVTILQKEKPLLKVTFEDFPSLGIWTKVGAPFICIEPWFGYSDPVDANGNILEKEAIQILESKAQFHAAFQISIL